MRQVFVWEFSTFTFSGKFVGTHQWIEILLSFFPIKNYFNPKIFINSAENFYTTETPNLQKRFLWSPTLPQRRWGREPSNRAEQTTTTTFPEAVEPQSPGSPFRWAGVLGRLLAAASRPWPHPSAITLSSDWTILTFMVTMLAPKGPLREFFLFPLFG